MSFSFFKQHYKAHKKSIDFHGIKTDVFIPCSIDFLFVLENPKYYTLNLIHEDTGKSFS